MLTMHEENHHHIIGKYSRNYYLALPKVYSECSPGFTAAADIISSLSRTTHITSECGQVGNNMIFIYYNSDDFAPGVN